MLTFYDYLNIAFYFVFIIGVGIYFARKSESTSDYFRGGGVLPWWVTGASAWMAGFSAWTFTGAAGKIYETGTYVIITYYGNILPLLFLLAFTCYRFRRMRVVTPAEAIRLRFGPSSQQFYTWIRLPLLLLFSGVGLNAIAVFMAAVFNLPIDTVLIGLGVIVTVTAMFGGSIGVAASDFVQMFLLVSVVAVVVVLALSQPAVGGITGLVQRVPPAHFAWNELARPEFIGLWMFSLAIGNIMSQNSMESAQKFLMSRSDSHARKMLWIPLMGTIFGPFIFFIPSMAAAITNTNLAEQFPNLTKPNEAAFFATAANVLPQGMLGLLVCALFAASLTDLSGNLNTASGLVIRNFYLAVVNPKCPEDRLLLLSRIATPVFGALFTIVALIVSRYRTMGLFDLTNQLAASLGTPLAIPVFWGLFYKRTPAWSTWSTVLIGLAAAYYIKFLMSPAQLAWLPGFAGPYKPEENTAFGLFASMLIIGGVCTAWFFFSSLFYERSSAEYKAGVEEFFTRLRTPVSPDTPVIPVDENGEPIPGAAPIKGDQIHEDHTVPAAIGRLCFVYGVFIALLILVPNNLTGRLCFAGIAAVMLGIGTILVRAYGRLEPKTLEAAELDPQELPAAHVP